MPGPRPREALHNLEVPTASNVQISGRYPEMRCLPCRVALSYLVTAEALQLNAISDCHDPHPDKGGVSQNESDAFPVGGLFCLIPNLRYS